MVNRRGFLWSVVAALAAPFVASRNVVTAPGAVHGLAFHKNAFSLVSEPLYTCYEAACYRVSNADDYRWKGAQRGDMVSVHLPQEYCNVEFREPIDHVQVFNDRLYIVSGGSAYVFDKPQLQHNPPAVAIRHMEEWNSWESAAVAARRAQQLPTFARFGETR